MQSSSEQNFSNMKKSDEILNPAYCKIAYQPSTYESRVLIR